MSIKKMYYIFCYLVVITLFFNIAVCAAVEEQRTIQTYGEAEITAQPDLVKISISIETHSKSANEAAEENARLANSVLKELYEFGLLEENIKTSSYRLNSYRKWEKEDSQNEQEQVYFQAVNEIIIQTIQLDKAGNIIDLAVKAGANNINYINFELKDPTALMLQTLTMATEHARQKADAIARGAGLTIKQLFNVREERTSYAPYRSQNTMLSREMVLGTAPTPISPDEVIIRATVVAEFTF
jgi:uncharacterized protein YggE